MNIYWIIVTLIIGLGLIMPQYNADRKYYIIIMAIIHTFVSGFRYMYLTGDLRNYAADYYDYLNLGWFNSQVFQDGRNTGFLWLMKLVSGISGGNFQTFLIVLAIISEVVVAVIIYKYSAKPWLSYLVWNCMGFYVAGFSLIKQHLAMSLILCAMICIFEKKPKLFLIFTLIAGFFHMPALIFLPAYFLANRKINANTILGYIIFAAVIFIFRSQIVNWIANFYYDEENFKLQSTGLGGRFTVIVLILICAILLKGFQEKIFEQLFNIIVIAAILQMFSSFDNIFSRLADYYLQFLILFIPLIFYQAIGKVEISKNAVSPILRFDRKSLQFFVMILTFILVLWYNVTCIGVTTLPATDDYTNYRFMWDVR